MRTLLLHPRFPPSYWSYEGLLKMIGRKTLLPPLNLITVAAIMPQDWEYRLIDCNADAVTEQDWQWAELVCVSGMMVQKPHMLELIAEANRRQIPVAAGGPYVTSVPEEVLAAGANFLVLDEGEITIPPFIAALERGDESGVFSADGAKADMTTSPAPRYDLLNLQNYSEMSLQFSRGCPFSCEFCDIIVLYGRKPRTKTPQQILAELQCLYDLGWRRSLFMVDDNFIGNKKSVKPMLRQLKDWQLSRGYPFAITTEASVNLADDAELLDLMVHANFSAVFLGIETPDVASLKLTKKNQNTRRPLVDQVHTITRSGLRVIGSFIIGFDGEKAGADQRILDFVNEAGIPHVMVSMLQALPKTHLMDRLRKENRVLDRNDHAAVHQGCLTNFTPTRPLRELATEHINCNWQLYQPEAFMERTYRHAMMRGVRPVRKYKKLFRIRDRRELTTALTLLWRQGFVRRSRGMFWRYLFKMWREKPEAVKTFLVCCSHFEHFYHYRTLIKRDVETQMKAMSDWELDHIVNPAAKAG